MTPDNPRRGRPPKVEPTACDCLVCRLRDMDVAWEHALPIIAASAKVPPSRIDPITARLVGLP